MFSTTLYVWKNEEKKHSSVRDWNHLTDSVVNAESRSVQISALYYSEHLILTCTNCTITLIIATPKVTE